MIDPKKYYMPCWDCYYAHDCKYYKDSLWDYWIADKKVCPAIYYPFDAIYIANQDKILETMELPEKRRRENRTRY